MTIPYDLFLLIIDKERKEWVIWNKINIFEDYLIVNCTIHVVIFKKLALFSKTTIPYHFDTPQRKKDIKRDPYFFIFNLSFFNFYFQ